MKKFALLLVIFGVVLACGGRKPRATETAPTPRSEYIPPQMPAMITDTLEMMRWIEQHYWDAFPFADTAAVNDADYTEQAFANYIHFLFNIPRELGDESIGILFKKAATDKHSFQKMSEIAEKYLFDPNSPMRDEDYYIASLHAILANPALDRYERIRPQEQLRMAMKNRVGDVAADFTYTLASGRSGTLHTLRAPYTLIFFNNPGCPACQITIEDIQASPYLMRLIGDGTLKILGVYPDEDLTAWREHGSDFPSNWLYSYNPGARIKAEESYDLKAIPTLYLLDADKRVMLKDVMSIPYIENRLNYDINKR